MRMEKLLFFVAMELLSGILTTCEGQSSFPPKTATQQNTWGSSNASRAIDDNIDTCSLSAFAPGSSEYGWWQVDLGEVYTVYSVNVTSGTHDGSDPMYYQNFAISVGMTNNTTVIDSNVSLCYYFNNGSYLSAGIPTTFSCSSPLNGRYVTIKRRGGERQDAMGLCEVSIQHTIVSSTSTSSTTSASSPTSNPSAASSSITSTSPTSTSSVTSSSPKSTSATTSTSSATSTSPTSTSSITSSAATTSSLLTTSTTSSTKSYEVWNDPATIAAIVLGCILGLSLIVILIISIMHHRLRKESKKLQSASSEPKRASDAESINYEAMNENDRPPSLTSTMNRNSHQRGSLYPPLHRDDSVY